jgi:hypothetical protein
VYDSLVRYVTTTAVLCQQNLIMSAENESEGFIEADELPSSIQELYEKASQEDSMLAMSIASPRTYHTDLGWSCL